MTPLANLTLANIVTLSISSAFTAPVSLSTPLANITLANISTLSTPTINVTTMNTNSLVAPLANLTLANITTLAASTINATTTNTSSLVVSSAIVTSLNTTGTTNIQSINVLSNSNVGNLFVVGSTFLPSLNVSATGNISNITTTNVICTNLNVLTSANITNISTANYNAGTFSYRPTFQQGLTTSDAANVTSLNVASGSVTFGSTTGIIGVDTTFGANVIGIPMHMIIACSGEASNVAANGSYVATINAPTNMIITGTRAFLGTRPPEAANNQTLTINIGITSSPTVNPTSIYSSTQMTIGPGQYTSWSGSGSGNGTISSGSVTQGSFIRIQASCTNNGFPLPPQGLKVILYYKMT